MKSPKPTGFHNDTPPETHIRDRPEPAEDPGDDTFEIKNPFLANLFHYGMIGVILVIVFFLAGSYLFGRSGGKLPTFLIGGTLGVLGIVRWFKSSGYDNDGSGF